MRKGSHFGIVPEHFSLRYFITWLRRHATVALPKDIFGSVIPCSDCTCVVQLFLQTRGQVSVELR